MVRGLSAVMDKVEVGLKKRQLKKAEELAARVKGERVSTDGATGRPRLAPCVCLRVSPLHLYEACQILSLVLLLTAHSSRCLCSSPRFFSSFLLSHCSSSLSYSNCLVEN